MNNFSNALKTISLLYIVLFNISCKLIDNDSDNESGILWVECSGNEISDTVYYVSNSGNDDDDGLSEETAYKTILKAFKSIKPGGTIRILPGTYNESIGVESCGSLTAPILIEGYNGVPILFAKRRRGVFYIYKACLHTAGKL